MSGGQNTLTIKADVRNLNAALDAMALNAEGAVRPAAQAAAQVLYDDVKANVGKIRKSSGNLAHSIYQVYSKSNSAPGRATYHVSWNAKTAPHANLVEYGHLQRYRYYQGSDGQIRPMVRPGMDGKRRPRRRASQAEKDAYYVTLPQPVQVPARPFLRPAIAKFADAMEAAKEVLVRSILEGSGALK
jgi:HK97 gp10 family phage protein